MSPATQGITSGLGIDAIGECRWGRKIAQCLTKINARELCRDINKQGAL